MLTLGMLAVSALEKLSEYVGGQSNGQTGGSTDWKINFALTGGTDDLPREGDIVIISYEITSTNNISFAYMADAVAGRGYTQVADLYADDNYDCNFYVGYKIMGAVPDTFVDVGQTGSGVGQSVAIHVWRNIDPDNPLDVASVPATGTNTGVPATQSITPISPNAIAIFTAASAGLGGAALANANLENFNSNFANTSTYDSYAAIGSKVWGGSGAVSSGTWSGGAAGTTGNNSWASVAMVLRPKNVPAEAPVNTAPPEISGNAYAGGVVTCSTGSWSGNPAPTFGFQWKLDGVNIGGATAQNYTCLAGDVGKTLTCTVTATNTQGSATATTAGVLVVSIAMPNILGTPTRGSSATLAHEVVAGTKCLIVRIACSNENTSSAPSACSWNGVAMTRGAYCYGSNNNNGANAVIFYLMNPTPGTGNLSYAGQDNRIASCENWANVSGVGDNKTSSAGSSISSFSFTFTKTNALNVLIAAAILRQGTAWSPQSGTTEEYDGGWSSPADHRAFFGRQEAGSAVAAICSGGNNTFGACGLELVAG